MPVWIYYSWVDENLNFKLRNLRSLSTHFPTITTIARWVYICTVRTPSTWTYSDIYRSQIKITSLYIIDLRLSTRSSVSKRSGPMNQSQTVCIFSELNAIDYEGINMWDHGVGYIESTYIYPCSVAIQALRAGVLLAKAEWMIFRDATNSSTISKSTCNTVLFSLSALTCT
jgi:hypothetical protein